ncbi:MAG: hypothetical protein J5I52_02800 [Saprospiraceae bacterium]|nr:hypothetical protein [Saprospiraceae bacterium]MCZ2337158.1 hypothetical protein [Chitinophagales bacterium]
MKDRKIISALTSISIYELNSFSKYIHSPFFNVNTHITTFYEVLEEAIRDGSVEKLTPKQIWSRIHPNVAYNNQKFLKLNSDLVNHFENFMAQREFDQAESVKTNFKLEAVRKRNIEKLYNGIIGEVERLQKTEFNQSAEFYMTKYLIERNLFSLKTENEKKTEKTEITSTLNIKDISDNLDYFYIIEKLKQFCTLLSWKKMYKLDIEMDNMNYVLDIAQSPKYQSIAPIQIYYKMYLTYVNEHDAENYYELRQLSKEYLHIFPIDEQREIYSTLLGYCINRINKNQQEFFKETFEVYKDSIDQKIMIINDELSVTTFRNIVIAALRVDEFEWAENFIYENAKYVDEKFRSNAVEFSLARLEFYKKDYDKVLDHLYKVSYEDVWYNINAKTIYLHTYYELDEFDALESLLQSFKMFVKREKSLTQARKDHYLNLIKFTNALIKINPRDKTKLQKLAQEINDTRGVVSKPWLQEKIELLLQGK